MLVGMLEIELAQATSKQAKRQKKINFKDSEIVIRVS